MSLLFVYMEVIVVVVVVLAEKYNRYHEVSSEMKGSTFCVHEGTGCALKIFFQENYSR